MVSGFSASIGEIDEFGDPIDSAVERSVWAGGMAAAFRPVEAIAVGGTLKGVSDRAEADSASNVAADFGLSASWQGFHAGLAMRNLGTVLRPSEAGMDQERLASEARIGGAYAIGFPRILVGAEYAKAEGRDARLGFGAQWRLAGSLAVRAGLSGMQVQQRQITCGFSVASYGFGLDYAFVTHELGMAHRMSLSYLFGNPTVTLATGNTAP
jgi:hypothetical protein